MALQVNYAIQELPDSTGFVFYETTGDYNATTNPTGWGAPNPVFSTAYFAELTLKDNAGNVIGVADTEFQFNLFDSNRKFLIEASFYGLPSFSDMVLEIIYTARQTYQGTVLSALDNKVLLDSVSQTNLKNAELKIPSCAGNIISTVTGKLQVYRGLLTAYGQMVPTGVYNEADLGIKQLAIDTENLCLEC